ncbi:hypothetical protein [Paenibacillus sp. UMB4589-SE434]|uniref:hypothetical protein n=1 Tax=Paenibacillus sp. UMB4589-SE434 TaxID=3046314 RepID=UPI00254DF87A|nr:hypothetical protein [Paenibacillus sp. UMB4589-SE434]MDK8179974.1 hypothetical protein [Paenibacillus sp. UMB4589-SE434]
MKNKTILDIRYFGVENYHFDISYIGDRYARKLREFDFKTREYDHIYINFNDSLQDGHIEISPQDDWRIYVNIGVSVIKFNILNPDEKFIFIIELTTEALRALCERDGLDFEVVQRVKNLMLQYNTELEIVHKEKETAKYKVVISYQIRPLNKASISFVEYTDKITGVSKKKILTKLKTYTNIYFLVSTISVTKDAVTLKPRNSSTTQVHLRSYRTPIQIPIEDFFTNDDKISSQVMFR